MRYIQSGPGWPPCSEYVLTLLVTAAVTYLLTPLVRRGAIAVGAMHEPPGDRDVHVGADPAAGAVWRSSAAWPRASWWPAS